MEIPPARGHDGGSGGAGGGYLSLLPPEHSIIVYFEKDYYGPVSGGGSKTVSTSVQAVVGTGRGGFGGDEDGGLGGRNVWRRGEETDRVETETN